MPYIPDPYFESRRINKLTPFDKPRFSIGEEVYLLISIDHEALVEEWVRKIISNSIYTEGPFPGDSKEWFYTFEGEDQRVLHFRETLHKEIPPLDNEWTIRIINE